MEKVGEEKKQANGILIIDGAYFNLNLNKKLKANKGNYLCQDKEYFMDVLQDIEWLCNVQFTKRFYISSDFAPEKHYELYT